MGSISTASTILSSVFPVTWVSSYRLISCGVPRCVPNWVIQLGHSISCGCWCQVCVTKGHLNRGVAHQLTDGVEWNAFHGKLAGKGVSHSVERKPFHARCSGSSLHWSPNLIVGQIAPMSAWKHQITGSSVLAKYPIQLRFNRNRSTLVGLWCRLNASRVASSDMNAHVRTTDVIPA